MVEAAEISSITGDLPSMGHETPDPITSVRTENPLQALSNRPNRVTGWRKIVAGAAGGAALITGTGAMMSPDQANAGGNQMLYTAGSGDSLGESNSIYCTPEYIAQYPQLLAGGDSNVGGEPTTQSNGQIAEITGGDTAAIQVPENTNQRVIVNFTNEDGNTLSILLPVCPPTGEQVGDIEFPSDPDLAQKMFLDGTIKIQGDKLFTDPATESIIKLGLYDDRKTKNTDNGTFFGTVLGVEKRNKNYLVLFGSYDKKGKPFTYIQKLDGNFNGGMAYEHLPTAEYELMDLQIGQIPVDIDKAAKDLMTNQLGEVISTINYTREINVGVPYFDTGLAKVARFNDNLFDCMLDLKRGRLPDTHVVGMNTPLSALKNNQIDELPSVWGIITRGAPPQITQ